MLLEPKDITVDGKAFIISKFPAMSGREIITKYPLSGIPKIGDYSVNEETMLKLMSFVAVPINGGNPLPLSTKMLIDNHMKDWEMLVKVEMAMLEYNCSFFQNGRISSLLTDIAQNIPQWTTKILTALSGQLLQTEKPQSTNSEQSTP